MTQADLQRDVEALERVRAFVDSTHGKDAPAEVAALDRAIETARILASMSDQQRASVTEGCAGVATTFASIDPVLADAHRKVARLMGGM